jgi:hypothetical protein
MSTLTILYWRDIPAQVIARAGRTVAKRELSLRFTEAIDMAAMKSGAKDADAYLAEWRRGEPVPCAADLETEAARLAGKLEAAYDAARLKALALNGGREAT